MSTPEPSPSPPSRSSRVVRLLGATLITLFLLTFSEGTMGSTGLAVICTPLLLICIGNGRWKLVENLGWALLIILLMVCLPG